MQSIGQPAFPTGAIVAKSYRRACQLMDRLLEPEMNILVDELADYHSWLLGSYKEKQTKTCCLYSGALPTIARCPPGSYGKMHRQCTGTQNDMITAMLCGVSVRDGDMIRM